MNQPHVPPHRPAAASVALHCYHHSYHSFRKFGKWQAEWKAQRSSILFLSSQQDTESFLLRKRSRLMNHHCLFLDFWKDVGGFVHAESDCIPADLPQLRRTFYKSRHNVIRLWTMLPKVSFIALKEEKTIRWCVPASQRQCCLAKVPRFCNKPFTCDVCCAEIKLAIWKLCWHCEYQKLWPIPSLTQRILPSPSLPISSVNGLS